jgi:hypothetical protein
MNEDVSSILEITLTEEETDTGEMLNRVLPIQPNFNLAPKPDVVKTNFKLNVPASLYESAGLDTLVSDMGKLMPICNSNIFYCDNINKSRSIFYHKCQLSYTRKCTGRLRVTTSGEFVESGHHSHPPEPAIISVKKLRSQIKQKAQTSEKSTKELYSELRTLDEESLSQVPKSSSIARDIQRHRDPINNNPPKTRDFDVPERFLKNKDDKNWIAFDTGKEDPQRIVGFATQAFLIQMFTTLHLFADGTFNVAPSLYFQLLTIHGIVMGVSMPLLYVLLPNKKGCTYDRLMTGEKLFA